MRIIHVCPANLATGGTEGIHHLVSELNAVGAEASISYVGMSLENPQPIQYSAYNCPYITKYPDNYNGAIIFPEILANKVVEDRYKDCITVVNWQGVDVYKWNTPSAEHGIFLQNKKTLHIVMSEYGKTWLQSMGITPIKIPDCINEIFLEDFEDNGERGNIVLYNPVEVKLTDFQKYVMEKCNCKFGIEFKPLAGYSREELIDIFRQSKLYIDFGAFSGRERLPREAVACGCCILTGRSGTAGYYEDNPIPDRYKITNVDSAIGMVKYILENYDICKKDFDYYRQALKLDNENYHNQVKEFYNAVLNHNSCP